MAFITYPLNNIDYTAEDAELFHCTRTSGIWAQNSFPISVTGADNNVTVGKGLAWINNEEFSGKVTALKSAEVLDMGVADGTYPRIDVVAIQFNANNNATGLVVKKGTPASTPIRPAIVRTNAVYELYLASIYRPAGATAITFENITDLRMDETVCGLMADSVTKVDMTAIEAQIRAFINNLQNEIDEVKNLSGLMFETEWVEDGVIPVLKGGTGATSAEEARDNLGVDFAYEGMLTAADDLNTVKTNGVYLYDTGDAPQNCPFQNAGIVEVLGQPDATTTRKIQRVSRYGSAEVAFRGLSTGGWSNWIIINTSSNVGAMKGELLWTNASTGSNFSAQTISLSKLGVDTLSPYAFIIVQFVVSTGASTHQSSAPIFRSTGKYSTQYQNSDGKELRRLVSATVSGGVEFDAGKRDETTDNSVMIPEKIYGFKLS